MYQLVARLEDALGDMKEHLETHICSQGLAAVEELGESSVLVNFVLFSIRYELCNVI